MMMMNFINRQDSHCKQKSPVNRTIIVIELPIEEYKS